MGYDISHHALDLRLLREQLVPALKGAPLSDAFLSGIVARSRVSGRANEWGLRVVNLDHKISHLQRQVAPSVKYRRERPAKGWFDRLRGKKDVFETDFQYTSGLPGFDSDLSVWGRPFFIAEPGVDAALDAYQAFLGLSGNDLSEVDALCLRQLQALESRRDRIAPEVSAEARAVLDDIYPLAAHLPELDEEDRGEVDPAATIARMNALLALQQRAWALRDTDEEIESEEDEEPISARDLAAQAPFWLVNMAAQALPGWMSRGHVWPTALLEKIGVSTKGIFRSPSVLFDELLGRVKGEGLMPDTIVENFSLGGYVRPEDVSRLRELLLANERALVFAWEDIENPTELDFERASADFRKIIETVTLAERGGHAFIEAAEVYSGFMGVMN